MNCWLRYSSVLAIALLAYSLLAEAKPATQALLLARAVSDDLESTPIVDKRLAGLYVKEGNENGQLRFLASGFSNSNTGSSSSLNAALNQYITQKQDMLEQLRPVSTTTGVGTSLGITNLGTGTSLGTATATGTGTATATNALSTTDNGAIVVNVAGNSASSSSSSSTTVNSVLGSNTNLSNLLSQISVNRRRQPARRRVVNRRGQAQRRRRGNKRGNKRPKVTVIRPNRG